MPANPHGWPATWPDIPTSWMPVGGDDNGIVTVRATVDVITATGGYTMLMAAIMFTDERLWEFFDGDRWRGVGNPPVAVQALDGYDWQWTTGDAFMRARQWDTANGPYPRVELA